MAWNFPAPAPLAPFGCWPYTMAIPKFYWDAESQEQRVKYLCMLYDKLMAYVDALKDNVNVDSEAIKELQEAFQKFMDSGFDDYYAEQIEQWINDNMTQIISESIKMVFFGLTLDGYFCAFIPDSWCEIEFDTGMIYGSEEYGRLILKYNVDCSNTQDNTGTYDEPELQDILNRIKQLETAVGINNATLYTPIQPGIIETLDTGQRINNPLA